MRVKTDDKRQAIMDAAWEVFKANGFERTSMSEISGRIGGSKGTLYSYFKSKEELFAAALEKAMQGRSEAAFAKIDATGDLAERLTGFARVYMTARLEPDMIAASRALICEADRSDFGATLLARFITPQWRRLATALRKEMDGGRLRRADPFAATLHFRGMIESDILERRLHGDRSIRPEDVEAAIACGVETFLRAYAPG